MKNKFFILPFVSGILTACSTQAPAPVVSAQSTTAQTGAVSSHHPINQTHYGWQPTSVQAMPAPYPTLQPLPQHVPVPSNQVPPVIPTVTSNQTIPQPLQPILPSHSVKQPQTSNQVTDVVIPRDQNNTPIYSQINKGFYNGETYTVRKGDTMFLISYITGKEPHEIARLNNLVEPYTLYIGQILRVNLPKTQHTAPPQVTERVAPVAQPSPQPNPALIPPTHKVGSQPTQVTPKPPTPAPVHTNIKWQWPTQGNIIIGFSSADGGNKGIDIAGNKGQAIKAAAAGRVTYAGNDIPGYGNMIFINHNNQFMSVYAHNDKLNVKIQDKVKAGQVIATMGSTGTNTNKLHFEIRHMGKSVDPMLYLPQ